MAIILITSYGTLGDVLPFIALGIALRARDHHVYMAVPDQMQPQVISAGLEAIPIGHTDVNPQRTREAAALWNHWSTTPQDLKAKTELNTNSWFDINACTSALLTVCKDADLIVCNPQQELCAAVIAEKLAIPLARCVITPALAYEPNNWWRLAHWQRERATQEDAYQYSRREQGLTDFWQSYWTNERVIVAASPHLFPSPPHCQAGNQTGFWFYDDPEKHALPPDIRLQRFFSGTPKPLVISFSSQPVSQRQAFIDTHLRAAAKLGYPVMVQGGWSDFNATHLPSDIDPTQVLFSDFLSQDWLFSQASALITHGGIGTIARALRHGCPMFLEPYTYEQCFNARKVLSWGVGAAMHPEKLTADGIANVLKQKTLTRKYKEKALAIKNQLHRERGVDRACELIESWL